MEKRTRRDTLKLLATGAGATLSAAVATDCSTKGNRAHPAATATTVATASAASGRDVIQSLTPLGAQWPVSDPFVFCAHHDDHYPAGNDALGPATSLAGRNIGQDFEGKDGWRMYHGEVVPGFPRHPHRGFETVTVVRTGMLDHSDSLGATARYGGGDVQWLTAGRGIQHAEMFPLLDKRQANPLELFQIWMNLPAVDKMVDPHFSMFWNDKVPRHRFRDPSGRAIQITTVAGRFPGAEDPPAPPPHSWAARPQSDVAIWTIKLAPGARMTLPAATAGANRALYFFRGDGLQVAGQAIPANHRIVVRADLAFDLVAGDGRNSNASEQTEILLLQGRPINEPVVQYGPFVMNTETEIRQAFADFQATQFGGWPWPAPDPVHARNSGRFALHTDGRLDKPA